MNEAQTCEAPRSPGIEPRWTSSAKSGVGTALLACTRDLGLIVTGEHGFFSEEKRHAEHQIKSLASGIPAYDLVNTHAGHYRITKRIVSDPYRDVVLQRLTFEALSQTGGRYRVYALLAPHLVNAGASNTAWLGEYKGVPMLFAQGRGTALAMACTVPWRNASAGFVGYSDGWQMLSRNGKLDPIWTRAQNGNVALIGEIDFTQADEVTLALGFGQHPEEAAQWSTDGWRTTHDDPTRDTGLGVHVVDVPAATLAPGTTIQFTLFWTQHQRWEGTDFSVEGRGTQMSRRLSTSAARARSAIC